MNKHPKVAFIGADTLVIDGNGHAHSLAIHGQVDDWTYMARFFLPGQGMVAVLEDLSALGFILYVNEKGTVLQMSKSMEPTRVDENECYLGHTKEEVFGTWEDILGKEILAKGVEPTYEEVAAIIPPIRHMEYYEFHTEAPHTYIGSLGNGDVIPVYYNAGRQFARINPYYVTNEIDHAVKNETIWEGLVGGWLPVVRMMYPMPTGGYWESISYANTRTENSLIQPARYRFLKLVDGKVLEAHYYDSYMPYPLETEPEPAAFYQDLFVLHSDWCASMPTGMKLSLPDPWVDDFCKHSFVLEMITRFNEHPRYGLINKEYGSPEHDGFMDTLTTAVACYLEWGMFDTARKYMDYYFQYFITDQGCVRYRGPSIGQYARILIVLAQYYDYAKDGSLLLRHEGKIRAIVALLLSRREKALLLPKESPRYGMIAGRNEADMSFLFNATLNFANEHPYFSINATAWRGFRDLGKILVALGTSCARQDLADFGRSLLSEAKALNADLKIAMERSVLRDRGRPFLPTIAGSAIYYYDVPYRSCPDAFDDNREWCELMHAGNISKEYIDMILTDAREHQSMMLGIFGNRKLIVAFICYGEAYGLIQHDMIHEFLLFYYTHIAHLHTRGTWSTFECVDMDRDRAESTSYCPPAQLTIPIVTKWMLVFEDPLEEKLWLAKATPRKWLENGCDIGVDEAPTRFGRVSYHVDSRLDEKKVNATVLLPEDFEAEALLRLRLPKGNQLAAVTINGEIWTQFDPERELITLPQNAIGLLRLEIDIK